MGQHSAWAVTLNWAHLPANPFKVLIKMALFLPDDHERPRWFAGDQMLLEAIGKAVPPWDDSPEARRARHTGDVLLRRAIHQLIAEGALEYRIRPMKGTRPEYWCHWEPQQTVAAYATDSCGIDNKLLQEPQQTVVPKEKRGKEKNRQERESPEATNSPAAVDDYAQASKILGALPDLGATYLEQVGHIDGITQRVIEAANLARNGKGP